MVDKRNKPPPKGPPPKNPGVEDEKASKDNRTSTDPLDDPMLAAAMEADPKMAEAMMARGMSKNDLTALIDALNEKYNNEIPHNETGNDLDDDKEGMGALVDSLGLNGTNENTVLGGTIVLEKPEEVPESELDTEAVIRLLRLDRDALNAGREACLLAHNEKRRRHEDTPDMASKFGDRINEGAQHWAEQLASGAQFGYQPNIPFGENIYRAALPNPVRTANAEMFVTFAQWAVEAWYNQVDNYDFAKRSRLMDESHMNTSVGSFTQVIWRESRILGVGIALSPDGRAFYVVCRYYQKGNIEEMAFRNVGALKPQYQNSSGRSSTGPPSSGPPSGKAMKSKW
ncbi:Oidioi.mRNA.OKI2018_I69.chr1.g1477.t1.cds [Oikopleura dioica]|uniref:Oidioi.mRNA.OKI2018_I69.chr1.g1477.t1.cds n=1 Tax=Oikopleura dioica TaxID=34765 RepID=A0ABN7SX95_OIKDI|nr:Oidioi.mRNA.OKI2018_I69.chr1.g1477.t1.cds [Oikopleura dioica]